LVPRNIAQTAYRPGRCSFGNTSRNYDYTEHLSRISVPKISAVINGTIMSIATKTDVKNRGRNEKEQSIPSKEEQRNPSGD
jgi:hypothetical protein